MDSIEEIEKQFGVEAKKEILSMQDGDVNLTWVDVDSLKKNLDYNPQISIKNRIHRFLDIINIIYNLIFLNDAKNIKFC